MEERRRDVLPDILKGFGIFLVVLGHCIQSGSGSAFLTDACYFDDKWYQFIYSFHMPLFMVVSGYYAWNSVRRAETPEDRRRMIGRKCVYLITPNIAWKLIEFVYMFVAGTYTYWGIGALLKDFSVSVLTNFWFFWAILYSFLLVCVMHYWLRDSVWIYVLIFIAMFFTPDGMALNAYKYMLPYYLIGFYGNKNKEKLLKIKLYQRMQSGWAIAVSGVLFLGLFCFFTRDSFIYLTGYKLIGKNYIIQLQIDTYRFLVGICGILFWTLVWRALLKYRAKWDWGVRLLSYLGRRGFGIYIVSGIFVVHVITPVTWEWEPRYGLNLVETIAALAASAAIVEGMRRIPWVCMLVGENPGRKNTAIKL